MRSEFRAKRLAMALPAQFRLFPAGIAAKQPRAAFRLRHGLRNRREPRAAVALKAEILAPLSGGRPPHLDA